MKKRLLLLTLILFSISVQGQIKFQKFYGGNNSEIAVNTIQTRDGGYLMTGLTMTYGAGDDDVYLIKTDSNGSPLWTKVFGGVDLEIGQSAVQTSDGGYLIVAITWSFGRDALLLRTDSLGNLLWSKTIGGSDLDQISSIKAVHNGYFLSGYTESYGSGNEDLYVIKLDTNANVVWTKTYGGVNPERGNDFIVTRDGGFVIAGLIYVNVPGLPDMYMLRADSAGNFLWSRAIGGTYYDEAYRLQETPDSGFVVVGRTGSFPPNDPNILLIKTDANGNLLWAETIGGSMDDAGTGIIVTEDGELVITGYTNSSGAGDYDVFMYKTDEDGNSIYSMTYGSTGFDRALGIIQTADKGFCMYGESFNSIQLNPDVYLIKTDSSGKVDCNIIMNTALVSHQQTPSVISPPTFVSSGGVDTIRTVFTTTGGIETTVCLTNRIATTDEENFLLFPNPARTEIIIHLPRAMQYHVQLKKYTGELLQEQITTNINPVLNRSALTTGLYFLNITDESGKTVVRKFVKAEM